MINDSSMTIHIRNYGEKSKFKLIETNLSILRFLAILNLKKTTEILFPFFVTCKIFLHDDVSVTFSYPT